MGGTAGPLPLIHGGYACIYADPPWSHVMRSAKGITKRHPSNHYPVMSREELLALPVRDLAARDCHLFLWTTWPHLEQALALMQAWGFRYSSLFNTWAKLNPHQTDALWLTERSFAIATGYTSRKQTEPLLLGRRGRPKRLSGAVRELIIAPRGRHSVKPVQAYENIERYCTGPRLELFARNTRPGWTSWGNEVGGADPRPAPPPSAETKPPNGASIPEPLTEAQGMT